MVGYNNSVAAVCIRGVSRGLQALYSKVLIGKIGNGNIIQYVSFSAVKSSERNLKCISLYLILLSTVEFQA